NLEFLNGIDRRIEIDEVVTIIHGCDAVDIHLHPDISGAVGNHAGSDCVGLLADDDAGRNTRELKKVAAVQRQVYHAFAPDDFTQHRVFRRQQWWRRGHFHGFFDLTDLERDIDAGKLRQLENDAGVALGSKALHSDLEAILSRLQVS